MKVCYLEDIAYELVSFMGKKIVQSEFKELKGKFGSFLDLAQIRVSLEILRKKENKKQKQIPLKDNRNFRIYLILFGA